MSHTMTSEGGGRAQGPDGSPFFEFDGFRLDTRRRLLYADGSMEPLSLAVKAIETLMYLVEHAGEVVHKDDLMKAVWPHVVVEDNNLERQISLLRRSLGEVPGENRFIATVPGRGYRFVATVTRAGPTRETNASEGKHAAASLPPEVQSAQPTAAASSATSLPASLRTFHLLLAAVAATVLGALALIAFMLAARRDNEQPAASAAPATRPSLAVMLCSNLTGDARKDVLAESIARDLIRLLGRNSGLWVPFAASSFAYHDRYIDTRQVARELNVTHVLECSLQPSPDGLQVAVELGDGATGKHIWSDSYELRAGDIQKQQGILASSIAQRVAPGLQASTTSGLMLTPPTTARANALGLFVQANGIVGATESNLVKALGLYDRAIEQDPTFAPAFAARAMTRMVQVPFGYAEAKGLDVAERDALEAVRLDPRLAEARATLGMMYGLRGRWMQSEEQMRLAASLDNNNWQTLSRHSLLLITAGKLQDALKEAKKAHEELAPLTMPAMVRHAIILSTLGEDDKAMRLVDSVLTMGGVTGVGEMPIMQAMAAFRAGRPMEAADRVLILLPSTARAEGADRVITQVFVAAAEGKELALAQAAKELRELTRRLPTKGSGRHPAHLLMLLSVLSGDLDGAFDAANRNLDYYAAVQAVGPWWYPLWIPELAPLRRDERFQALVERMHLPDYWNEYGPPDVPGCEWRDRKLHCS